MTIGKFDRICWYDLETTGLDVGTHHIMQLSYVIDICGDIVLERDIKFKPYSTDTISPQALKVTGIDKGELLSREMTAKDAFELFLSDLDKHKGGQGKGSPRFITGGYNIAVFDKKFLTEFFELNLLKQSSWPPKYYYYFYQQPVLDVMYFYMSLALGDHNLKEWHETEKFNLENIYTMLLEKDMKAHDALADIHATRDIYYALMDVLNI